ncbi:MAG: Transcriptional regulator, MerR family [Acidimicrobiales bacterium]|nr:Transcriptional regulator, MerR family [Acidimicrobiales bacterium]
MTVPEGQDAGDYVGRTVKARRMALALTIAELARRSEVSASFVSQLEAGQTSVSIPTLYRLANALGCSANALLPPVGIRSHVTRSGTGPLMHASEGRQPQKPRLLSRTGSGVALEAYHYVMNPGDDEQEWFEHPGEDLVYVIRGSVRVEFADGEAVVLEAGDSLHHDGVIAHRWALDGTEPAEVVVTIGAGGTFHWDG